jgi:hypothetical protein
MKAITKTALMIGIIHIIGCSIYRGKNNNGNTIAKSFKIYDEDRGALSKITYKTNLDDDKTASLRIILIPSKTKIAEGEEIVLSIYVTTLTNKPVLFPDSPLSYVVEAQFQRYTDRGCIQASQRFSEVSVSSMNTSKILPFDTKEFQLKWQPGKNLDKNIIEIKVIIADRIETNPIFLLTRAYSKRLK